MAKKKPGKGDDSEAEAGETKGRVVHQPARVISKTKLKSLLASARSTKADIDEIVGTHRAQIARAVEEDNLHKGAFAWIKRLDRLEPEKLAEWLDCFEHMLDISGIGDRAKQVQRLGLGDDDNVKQFPGPRQEAAE